MCFDNNTTEQTQPPLVLEFMQTNILNHAILQPNRNQAIIRINAGILLIGPWGNNFSQMLINIHTFLFTKCIWKCHPENGGHFVSTSMCQHLEGRCRIHMTRVLSSLYLQMSYNASPLHCLHASVIVSRAHYNDAIMSAMASQITSLMIVYWTVCSGADQRKHQSSASLAFVREINRWPVNSLHKGPVTRKMFPFDDVIMYRRSCVILLSQVMSFKIAIGMSRNSLTLLVLTRVSRVHAYTVIVEPDLDAGNNRLWQTYIYIYMFKEFAYFKTNDSIHAEY